VTTGGSSEGSKALRESAPTLGNETSLQETRGRTNGGRDPGGMHYDSVNGRVVHPGRIFDQKGGKRLKRNREERSGKNCFELGREYRGGKDF